MEETQQDWVKLYIADHDFKGANDPRLFRIVILHAGGLSVPGKSDLRPPFVLDAYTSPNLPFPGLRIRDLNDHYVVYGLEFRVDLDCYVAVITDNHGDRSRTLPRYFSDGETLHF